jgi:hypothetical protein
MRIRFIAALAILCLSVSIAGQSAHAQPLVPMNGPEAGQGYAVLGYWYHDGNHYNAVAGQPSPQAIYNATHGTWLWPPAAALR